jgi:hypothetical protein
VVRHISGPVNLRTEQAVSARGWGIWFEFKNEDIRRAYTTFLIHAALKRLQSNIYSLRYIEATYLSGQSRLSSTRQYDAQGIGARFEHLMLDVLNERQHLARVAPLGEDVLEKTDLSVSYPGLDRKCGARIQVSLTTDPKHHQTKVGSLRLPSEFVFLTPLDLAQFAILLSKSVGREYRMGDFWASLGRKHEDVYSLAQALHQMFIDALLEAPLHPLGPMWLLPLPLRQLIQAFTKRGAIETTRRVRERELLNRKPIGSARSFTNRFWKAKLSDSRVEP